MPQPYDLEGELHIVDMHERERGRSVEAVDGHVRLYLPIVARHEL